VSNNCAPIATGIPGARGDSTLVPFPYGAALLGAVQLGAPRIPTAPTPLPPWWSGSCLAPSPRTTRTSPARRLPGGGRISIRTRRSIRCAPFDRGSSVPGAPATCNATLGLPFVRLLLRRGASECFHARLIAQHLASHQRAYTTAIPRFLNRAKGGKCGTGVCISIAPFSKRHVSARFAPGAAGQWGSAQAGRAPTHLAPASSASPVSRRGTASSRPTAMNTADRHIAARRDPPSDCLPARGRLRRVPLQTSRRVRARRAPRDPLALEIWDHESHRRRRLRADRTREHRAGVHPRQPRQPGKSGRRQAARFAVDGFDYALDPIAATSRRLRSSRETSKSMRSTGCSNRATMR